MAHKKSTRSRPCVFIAEVHTGHTCKDASQAKTAADNIAEKAQTAPVAS